MTKQQTLNERKKELLEALIRDEEKIMNAKKNMDMNLAEGCKDMDYHLNESKKLEPKKSYLGLIDEIRNYAQQRSQRK